MAEGSGSSNTPIWVAVITVVGSLLTALIVNADKWIPRADSPAAAASGEPGAAPSADAASAGAGAAASAGSGAAASGADAAGVARRSEEEGASAPPSAPERKQVLPEPPAADAGPPDLGGEWRDSGGLRYAFEQSGARFELTAMAPNGNFLWLGKGTVSGRELNFAYEGLHEESGTCTARIDAAAGKIAANCLMSVGGGWTFTLER